MSDGGSLRLFAVLGAPAHHSLSPRIHNAAFRSLGLPAVYVALRTWDALVKPLMRELARRGGGGNVTVPHKARAAQALDRASEAVNATKACNAFWWRDGALCGDNTDVSGFVAAAETLVGGDLAGRRVLVLGAGGAARGVVYGCVRQQAARVDVFNRSRARAESLAADLAQPARLTVLSNIDVVGNADYDLIVNATSLGMSKGDRLPIDPRRVKTAALLDLVYGREVTPLVAAARAAGWVAEDGRRMLVEQAAAAFEIWFERDAPRDVMAGEIGLT